MIIVGGGDKRTGTGKAGFGVLKDFIHDKFPGAKERFAWAAQDCMSLDGMPYIGKSNSSYDDVYVVTGFNEWGMTSAMAAAEIIADMIEGKKNPFEKLFDPGRSVLKRQLFINTAESAKNLMKPSTNRCTHLGCALKENGFDK